MGVNSASVGIGSCEAALSEGYEVLHWTDPFPRVAMSDPVVHQLILNLPCLSVLTRSDLEVNNRIIRVVSGAFGDGWPFLHSKFPRGFGNSAQRIKRCRSGEGSLVSWELKDPFPVKNSLEHSFFGHPVLSEPASKAINWTTCNTAAGRCFKE